MPARHPLVIQFPSLHNQMFLIGLATTVTRSFKHLQTLTAGRPSIWFPDEAFLIFRSNIYGEKKKEVGEDISQYRHFPYARLRRNVFILFCFYRVPRDRPVALQENRRERNGIRTILAKYINRPLARNYACWNCSRCRELRSWWPITSMSPS